MELAAARLHSECAVKLNGHLLRVCPQVQWRVWMPIW